jgi:hypothetical protein
VEVINGGNKEFPLKNTSFKSGETFHIMDMEIQSYKKKGGYLSEYIYRNHSGSGQWETNLKAYKLSEGEIKALIDNIDKLEDKLKKKIYE